MITIFFYTYALLEFKPTSSTLASGRVRTRLLLYNNLTHVHFCCTLEIKCYFYNI